MKKFYSFSLMLGLVFGSLLLTSCGDDDKDEPATGGDIVGAWEADFNDSEIGMQDGFNRKVTYEFKQDNTFDIITGAYVKGSQTPPYWDSALRFVGTYSTANGKLTLTIKKYWEYDCGRNGTEEDRWRTGDNLDGSANFSEWGYDDANTKFKNPFVVEYSIKDDKLTLANGELILVNGFMNYVLTGTLTKQTKKLKEEL